MKTYLRALAILFAIPLLFGVAYAEDETLQWDNRTQVVSGCVTNNTAMDIRNLRCDATSNLLEIEVVGSPAAHGTAGILVVADADIVAAAANTRTYGCLVMEDAGTPAAAVGVLHHDVAAGGCTGDAIMSITLAASGMVALDFGARGIATPNGVCLDWTSGSFSVNCWSSVEAGP
jgi:hypothetical protein